MSHIVQNAIRTLMGDRLKISVVSQVATATLAVVYRMFNEQGDVVSNEHDVTITATGAQTVLHPIAGAHFIMTMLCSVTSGTVNPGDILVKVELQQGDVATQPPYAILLFGSPDSFMPIAMGRE